VPKGSLNFAALAETFTASSLPPATSTIRGLACTADTESSPAKTSAIGVKKARGRLETT
jgi:hypothetical protein